jgi:hypothetical protein
VNFITHAVMDSNLIRDDRRINVSVMSREKMLLLRALNKLTIIDNFMLNSITFCQLVLRSE